MIDVSICNVTVNRLIIILLFEIVTQKISRIAIQYQFYEASTYSHKVVASGIDKPSPRKPSK